MCTRKIKIIKINNNHVKLFFLKHNTLPSGSGEEAWFRVPDPTSIMILCKLMGQPSSNGER